MILAGNNRQQLTERFNKFHKNHNTLNEEKWYHAKLILPHYITKTFRHTKPDRKYLLTYSTVQSPSWTANWFAASQEIPRISRSPKVYYRTHKRPPPVSILGQPNPVHIPTSHLLEIRPNIIHPSTPRSPQWSPSLPLLSYLFHCDESFLSS